VWLIGGGWIPARSTDPEPEMTSHESACIRNASDRDAEVGITIYFSDRSRLGHTGSRSRRGALFISDSTISITPSRSRSRPTSVR
jgi:hypothetical protein